MSYELLMLIAQLCAVGNGANSNATHVKLECAREVILCVESQSAHKSGPEKVIACVKELGRR